jgi:hypothetical protein
VPQQAPARNDRPANHQPQRWTGAVEGAPQDVEADSDDDMDGERRRELEQIDLAPIDGGDHRPQHEREIARLRRALEQAPDEFGADEGLLSRCQGLRRRLGGRLSGGDRHRPSDAPTRHQS